MCTDFIKIILIADQVIKRIMNPRPTSDVTEEQMAVSEEEMAVSEEEMANMTQEGRDLVKNMKWKAKVIII